MIHMLVHLLGHRGRQNDSIKSEFDRALYVALENTPKITLYGALKNAQKCEEKDAFYAAVDDPLDRGAPRVHLTVHLRMHLAISIKMHKSVHVKLHLSCTYGYTC